MYIHRYTCISPQHTSTTVELETIAPSAEGRLIALEPVLEGVPPAMLRRMSKAVRMGIGAGLPLIKESAVEGIIIGTANGGMEDCIKFLNQIIDYNEGLLTPGNFVQSTPNAIAGHLSLIAKNHGYNATHVHNGLAFENALLDARMLVHENPGNTYLVGGVDEISSYNYNIDYLAGWYDKTLNNQMLYTAQKPATIAGEGAAMFLVSNQAENAGAKVNKVEIFQTRDPGFAGKRFADFIRNNVPDAKNTLLITGENGDTRHLPFYENAEKAIGDNVHVVRFKHATGEYPTASSFGLWLACCVLQGQKLPAHFYKTTVRNRRIENVVLYNQYQGMQHSLLHVSGVSVQ